MLRKRAHETRSRLSSWLPRQRLTNSTWSRFRTSVQGYEFLNRGIEAEQLCMSRNSENGRPGAGHFALCTAEDGPNEGPRPGLKLLSCGHHALNPDKSRASYGELLEILVIPGIFAYIVWRITRPYTNEGRAAAAERTRRVTRKLGRQPRPVNNLNPLQGVRRQNRIRRGSTVTCSAWHDRSGTFLPIGG